MILREGMFIGVHDSRFGIFSGQTRRDSEVIITQAGWYNQLGQVLGEGDLSMEDFVNIIGNLHVGDPSLLIVLPAKDNVSHKQLPPHVLAERCAFIIHPDVIHIVAAPNMATEFHFFRQRVSYVLPDGTEEEGPLPYVLSTRAEARSVLAELALH